MAKDILRYPGWMYSYGIASGQMSMDDAKIEYRRLYHALKMRQARLRESEFSGAKFAGIDLRPLRSIKSEADFLEQIQHMASWARSRLSTIKGWIEYRKDIASVLDQYGDGGKSFWDFTHGNWTEFGAYMKRIHRMHLDSERAVAVFRVAKDAGMTGASLFKDYRYWKDHTEELKDYAAAGRALGGRASSERIRNYIESH